MTERPTLESVKAELQAHKDSCYDEARHLNGGDYTPEELTDMIVAANVLRAFAHVYSYIAAWETNGTATGADIVEGKCELVDWIGPIADELFPKEASPDGRD